MNAEAERDLYRRDKQAHTSASPPRRENNAHMEAHKDFGNIDDDDIVNQNSSHDGRSHQNRSMLQRMEIDITQSTYVNEQANSPQLPVESALLQEEVK